MNRVAQIEQSVRSCESIAQLATMHSHAAHLPELVRIGGGRLMKKAIMLGKAMFSKTTLKTFDARAIGLRIARGRQQFQPNGIQLQPLQSEHPLERNRETSTAVAILCRETAAEKDGHRGYEYENKRTTPENLGAGCSTFNPKALGVSAGLEFDGRAFVS